MSGIDTTQANAGGASGYVHPEAKYENILTVCPSIDLWTNFQALADYTYAKPLMR